MENGLVVFKKAKQSYLWASNSPSRYIPKRIKNRLRDNLYNSVQISIVHDSQKM
jgi:hypothetical protein